MLKSYIKKAIVLITIFSSSAVFSAYLDFSSNWNAVSTIPMSKRTASSVVNSCPTVQNYAMKNGDRSGAMVVAGPHTSNTDEHLHLTVRLYNNGIHERTCHVYVDQKGNFTSCKCFYT